MKKYTEKELQAMSLEELQAVREQAMCESSEIRDELMITLRKEELLKQISADEKYHHCVFWGPGIYFVIVGGRIWTISDDAGSSPHGGGFPDIVTGPTEEEKECLQGLMDTMGFDETFFSEVIEDYGEFDEEYAEEFFSDNDDDDSLKIYRKLRRMVNSGKTLFKSIEDFASALARFELDDDLYYEWEGDYIHFFGNIYDCGEAPGYYDELSTAEWVEILEHLDRHIVTA